MPGVLADTGAFVALFDRDDPDHSRVVEWLREYSGSLITTWPVVTEVTHLLRVEAGLQFLAWVRQGGAKVEPMSVDDLAGLEELIARYRDCPMDFADATLVLAAERSGIGDIVTLDRGDFETYRFRGKTRFRNLLDSSASGAVG